MKVKKAVVIATESGRLSIPTEMIPLIDKPIIQYVVDEISQAGIEEVLIVLGENSDALIKHFEMNGNYDHDTSSMALKSAMVYFTKYPSVNDYAGAILSAKRFVGEEAFALLNATQIFVNQGEPVIKQVVDAYKYLKHSVLAIQETNSPFETLKAQLGDEDYYTIHSVALKGAEPLGENSLNLCGRAVLRPEIFSYLEHCHNSSNLNGRQGFIDAMDKMMGDQKFYGILIPGEKYDLSTKTGYIKSVIDLALDHSEFKEEIERHIGERMSSSVSV